MPKLFNKTAVNFCTVLGAVFCVLFVFYGFQHRLFTSQEALRSFVDDFGAFGAGVFILFQAVQVVVPILPGGLGCLAGVLLFGPWLGFVYNYVGICLGSLTMMFRQETIEKYEKWTNRHFARWFALAIFFPVAPDDFLCWLAGTTRMTLRRFSAIILLGKPASIALYSLGLSAAFQWVGRLLPA